MSEPQVPAQSPAPTPSRRRFLRDGLRAVSWTGLGALVGALGWRSAKATTLWQIDPQRCVQCGRCATHCVLEQSAVRCVNRFEICGYCDLCTGYFEPDPIDLNTGAENQLCPTGALIRKFVEDPYYEYVVDVELCIGCAKCVAGCERFGNGSLYLQVQHDRCLNCNECSIARVCAGDAFRRVPISQPYLPREIAH